MSSYCLNCRKKKQKVKFLKLQAQKNGRIMFLSKCAVCDNKKSKFIRQEDY